MPAAASSTGRRVSLLAGGCAYAITRTGGLKVEAQGISLPVYLRSN